MAKKLIGTDANQVPINGFLGDLAYQNADNLKRINVNSGTLFVDSANNRVGVGTSSPSEAFEVNGDTIISSSNASPLTLQRNAGGSSNVSIKFDGANRDFYSGVASTSEDFVIGVSNNLNIENVIRAAPNGDISFYEDTGTTPKFFWDASAERLGIGTSSPSSTLEIDGGTIQASSISNSYEILRLSGPAKIRPLLLTSFDAVFESSGYNLNAQSSGGELNFQVSSNDRLRLRNDGATIFSNNGSEAARIDSSGNLLVGTTSGNPAGGTGVGVQLNGVSGQVNVSRTDGASGVFNRVGSDGEIIQFRQDGSKVGSIGTGAPAQFTVLGDLVNFSLGARNTGLNFNDNNSHIRPYDPSSGLSVDNTIDLGVSYARFKDLYLSGALTNSGTGGVSVDSSGNVLPTADATYDLGSPAARWNNVYTTDLQLSNEGSEGNSVDGTTGNWTVQEGADDLYLINNNTGKTYRFKLQEIN